MLDFFTAIINGLVITVIGYVYLRCPPKEINWWYGYRTRRSMDNQEIWHYANKIGAKSIFFLGLFILTVSFLLYFFLPSTVVVIISTFLLLIGIGAVMYWCETQLNKHFDKNGNSKP